VKRSLAALLALLVALALPSAAIAVRIRASLTSIENDVMCVACHESLAVAQSPQAYAEREYIVMLIKRGETKAQIERELVAQYGEAVLAKPPASGFSLSLYVLPPALVAVGLMILVVTLPRWRARARRRGDPAGAAPAASLALNPADAQRVDEELSRYGG
jgi:cytochrome c-type biogenesis protein CcmH